jgi:hypothetical protein
MYSSANTVSNALTLRFIDYLSTQTNLCQGSTTSLPEACEDCVRSNMKNDRRQLRWCYQPFWTDHFYNARGFVVQ